MDAPKLNIGRRLFLAYTLFFLPVAYLLYSLVVQQNIAIDFAVKERRGNDYLTALREVQVDLHGGLRAGGGTGRAAFEAAARRVEAAERDSGEGMDSAELAAGLAGRLRALARSGGAPDEAAAALSVLRDLVARVGDRSNLILDPDLDSYYAMDVVLIKAPDLLDRVAAMATLAAAVAADGRLQPEERTDLLIQRGGLSALVEAIGASVEAGYRGNADGSLRAGLDGAHRAARSALDRFLGELDRGLAGAGGITLTAEAAFRVEADALRASAALAGAAGRELDRLLDARTQRFRTEQATVLATTALLFALALGIVVLMVSRGVSRPIRRMTAAMDALSHGDLDAAVPDAGRRDEIGVMAQALEVFKAGLVEARRLQGEREAAHAREQNRVRALEAATREFEAAVGRLMSTLDGSARQVHAVTGSLNDATARSVRRSSAVAASARQASDSVQTVAAATEELSASIREIRSRIDDAGRVGREGVEAVGGADRTIGGLAEEAGRIGDVVRLISDIASQTNLLALNATIEAARAGEAGRGFAVVANEVKHLADQTARATEEITGQIAAMQETTRQAVDSVKLVGVTMARIDQAMAAIAGAAEQQSTATQEIARNAQDAASGNAEVTREIAEVSEDAAASGETTGTLVRSADGLMGAAADLKGAVQGFLSRVNAA
jgi:methyl-accepting chemotaxis protein